MADGTAGETEGCRGEEEWSGGGTKAQRTPHYAYTCSGLVPRTIDKAEGGGGGGGGGGGL